MQNFIPVVMSVKKSVDLKSRLAKLFLPSLLVLCFGVTFYPLLHADFLQWDDPVNIFENPRLSTLSVKNILFFWEYPYQNLYIPITYTLWSITASLSRFLSGASHGVPDASVFHALNLLIHSANTLLVFFLLKSLTGKLKGDKTVKYAWAGVFIFALHPVQVETVSWITATKDLLFTHFSLLAILAYLKARIESGDRPGWIAAATFFFVFALLSKPAAVCLPALLILVEWIVIKRWTALAWGTITAWLLAAAGVILLTRTAQPLPESASMHLWERLTVAADAILFYIHKIVWPFSFLPDYGRSPSIVTESPLSFFTPVIVLGLIFLCVKMAQNRVPAPLFSLLFLIICIAPVSGLVPFAFQEISTVADRYAYLAMAGPALLLTATLPSLHKKAISPFILFLAISLTLLSARQVSVWKNTYTLFAYTQTANRESYIALINLATLYQKEEKLEKAKDFFIKSLKIRRNNPVVHNNLGVIFTRKGDFKKAEYHFSEALKIRPESFDTHYNLGKLYEKSGEVKKAMARYETALKLNPEHGPSHNNLGLLFLKAGNMERALFHLNEAVKNDPFLAVAYSNLGDLHGSRNRLSQAVTAYEKALQYDPENPMTYNNLGITLFRMGNREKAVRILLKGLSTDQHNVDLRNNLGTLYFRKGLFARAGKEFREALKAEPLNKRARNSLKRVKKELELLKTSTGPE